MYEKYPITGIKQSYRHTRDSRTVVMPILIATLMVAMGVFFVKSKPEEVAEPQDMVSLEESTLPASLEIENTEPVELPPRVEEPEFEAEGESNPTETLETGRETVLTPPVESGEFTAWMTPLALDTYIRHRNRGYSESFWERGHWITAVEGRWENGIREFRISFDQIPDRSRWQWQYRVNHTAAEFVQASREFSALGYKLVQSQTFREPSGAPRYQGVWRMDLAQQAPAVETAATTASAPTSTTTAGVRPLDVNNLLFR